MGIIAKQSIRGTIVTYLGVFVGFLTTFFVLTRFLSAEEIGLARVLIDTATLFVGLAQLGTSSSIIRFFPYFKSPTFSQSPLSSDSLPSHRDADPYNGFFFWTITIPLFGFIVVSALFCLFCQPLQSLFEEKSPLLVSYYYAVLPMAFFMLYQVIFETNANVLMRIVFPRAVRELFLRIFLLVAYLLYAFRFVSMNGFVLLLCLSYGLASLCNIVYLCRYGHLSFRPNFHFVNAALARKYFFYTLFQITAAITTVLAPTLSSFFITSQMGLEYTGIFAIATYMAAMVSIPNRSVNAIANPQIAQSIKDNDMPKLSTLLKQVSSNSLLVGAFIMAAICLNINLIFYILPNGDTYASAGSAMIILSLSQLVLSTCNASLSVLNFSPYYYISLFFSVILTALAVVFNNWLIPIYGMNGAALANLLSYSVYMLLIISTLGWKMRVNPFSNGHAKTLILFALMFALGWVVDTYLPICLWLASALKTIVILGGCGLIAIAWNISPEVNSMLKSFLSRLTRK